MPGFLQSCVSSVLLLSCIYFCSTSTQNNREKTLEVPVNETILLTDGRQRYFNLNSQFIGENPLVKFESSEKTAKFYVSVLDTNLHAKRFCREPINITAYAAGVTHMLCHGTGSPPITLLIFGNFSMKFKNNAVNHTPTEVHVLRYLTTNGVCQDKTDHQCGYRCFGSDAMCDGLQHCRDGSDEENCSQTSSSTYDTTTTEVIISTTPAGSRRCDLPGAAAVSQPETQFKNSWSVVVYCTGIIIGTLFCSIVIGFCFMRPYPDDEEEEQQQESRREGIGDGERRLDPLLDHPPSYEDVMSMDLSAATHRHAVPKHRDPTPDSP